MYSDPHHLVVSEVVEEHRASNVNEEEQDHLPDVLVWNLPETVKDWIDQNLFMINVLGLDDFIHILWHK